MWPFLHRSCDFPTSHPADFLSWAFFLQPPPLGSVIPPLLPPPSLPPPPSVAVAMPPPYLWPPSVSRSSNSEFHLYETNIK